LSRAISLLLASGAASAASVELTATLSTIGRLLVETIGVARCNIYDYDAEASDLEVIAAYQIPGVPDDREWIGQRFDADSWAEGVTVVAERESRTVYYDWAKLTPEEFAYMEPWGEKALIVVPIIYGDQVLGVLDVAESRYPRRHRGAGPGRGLSRPWKERHGECRRGDLPRPRAHSRPARGQCRQGAVHGQASGQEPGLRV